MEGQVAKTEQIQTTDNIPLKVETIDIRSQIHIVRGKQVMLDSDLAMLYKVETGALNRAVKRNKKRFPEDFCFQLTQDELQLLYSRSQNVILNEDDFIQDDVNNNISRSQSVTLNKNKKRQGLNIKYLPYAFTEQGIYNCLL